jgi:surface polysaccharide O-acyltransferase-like enzyme
MPRLGLRTFLTGGSAFHLWFLPALGVALVLVPAAILLAGRTVATFLCIVLAAASIALGGYREVLHLPEVGATRLMIAPLLVLTGYWLARTPPAVRSASAAAFVIAAWGLSLIEESTIAWIMHLPLRSHAVVASTLAIGITLFLFARTLPTGRLISAAAPLGRISLGIYASHLLFVRAFMVVIGAGTLARSFLIALLAFGAATSLSWMLSRVRLTRPLVR